jgi:hypothetical protein
LHPINCILFEEQFANEQRGRCALTAPDPRRRQRQSFAVGRGAAPLLGLACAIGQLVRLSTAGSERAGQQHLFIAHCSIPPQTPKALHGQPTRRPAENLSTGPVSTCLKTSEEGLSKTGRDARSWVVRVWRRREEASNHSVPRIKFAYGTRLPLPQALAHLHPLPVECAGL